MPDGQPPQGVHAEETAILSAFAQAVASRLELLGALGREQGIRTRQERELRRILEVSPDIIATIASDGTIRTVNPAAEKILGYETAELVGTNYLDLIHPADRNLGAGLAATLRGEKREIRFEVRCRRKDGGVVWIDWSATPAPEEAAAYCMGRDVTRRKSVEQALSRESDLTELLQAVTVAANEAPNLEEAVQCCLEIVWGYTGWPVGHAYLVDGKVDGGWTWKNLWHLEDPDKFHALVEATENVSPSPGVDLPGRVLAARRAIWIPDISQDGGFLRAAAALGGGLGTVLAFPVLVGG